MKKIAAIYCLLLCACAGQTANPPPSTPGQLPKSISAAMARSTTIPSDDNYKSHSAFNRQCEAQVAAMRGKPVDVIFIGDSITQNFVNDPTPRWPMAGKAIWDRCYAHRNALNFGVGADRTENVLWRLENMNVKDFRPKVAVVLIGTNNNWVPAEAIAAGVKAVLKKTQDTFPGVKIILVSILPNARATQKMADANKIIQGFGDDRSIFYFDLASKMTREGDGWKGIGRDHLHLTPEGYELWAAEMEPLLSRLLSGKT
jgi:lysophospholipase L1-like esterase